MRGRLLALGLVLLAAVGTTAGVVGCFDPGHPACAFTCAKGICPDGYTCGADGICRDPDSRGTCPLDPADGGKTD